MGFGAWFDILREVISMTAYKFRLEYNSAFAPKLLFATLWVAAMAHAKLIENDFDETGLNLTFDKDLSQAEIVTMLSTL